MTLKDIDARLQSIERLLQGSDIVHGYRGLAAYLKISPATAMKLVRKGQIKAHHFGKRVVFKKSELFTLNNNVQ